MTTTAMPPNVTTDDGRTPRVPWRAMWLPLNALKIDASYKHKLRSEHVQRLLETFEWDLVSPLRVSLDAQGDYWLVDGQHIAEVLKRLGHTEAYCYVEHMSQREQAQSVVAYGRRTKASALDRFRAALAHGDKEATAINSVIQDCGLRVEFNSLQKDPEGLHAVQTARAIYRAKLRSKMYKSMEARPAGASLSGADRLRWVLRLARDTWPDTHAALDGRLLTALDLLLTIYGVDGFDRAEFVRKLSATAVEEILVKAHALARARGRSGPTWALQEMVLRYNYQRRAETRLELPIKTSSSYTSRSYIVDEEEDNE